MSEEAKMVAVTILEQLGGNQFKVMTGAKDITFDGQGNLSFKIPIGKWMACRVELTPEDVYRVTFTNYSARGGVFRVTGESVHDDIYAENLRGLFERETGLRTSLKVVFA